MLCDCLSFTPALEPYAKVAEENESTFYAEGVV
jgi:hypothetical protein